MADGAAGAVVVVFEGQGWAIEAAEQQQQQQQQQRLPTQCVWKFKLAGGRVDARVQRSKRPATEKLEGSHPVVGVALGCLLACW